MGSTHLIFRGAPGDQAQQFIGVKDHMDRELPAEWRKRGDNDRHWELIIPHGDAATTAQTEGGVERIPLHPAAIARIVHQANQALQLALDEEVGSQWAHAPEWLREQVESGVRLAAKGHGPEAMHQSWMDERLANGWVYGEVKDEAAKTHPCLVPYDQLSADQRIKDHLFLAISRLFTVDDQQPYNAEDICPCVNEDAAAKASEPAPFSPEADESARNGDPAALGDSNGGDASAAPVIATEEPAANADAEVVLLRGGEFDGETMPLEDVGEPIMEEGAIVSFEVAGLTYKVTDEREGDKRVFTHVHPGGVPFTPDDATTEQGNDPQY